MAVAASVGLAGCGGSSKNTDDDTGVTPPKSYDVTLPDGHGLDEGTTPLKSGDNDGPGGTTLNCPSDDGCTITVAKDDVLGTYTATSTGGMVTVTAPAAMVNLELPAGNNIRDRIDQDDERQTNRFVTGGNTLTVPANDHIDYGGVRFTCDGDTPCKVYFDIDRTPGIVAATTGGHGNGVAEAKLLSTVGTGVGLSSLRELIVDKKIDPEIPVKADVQRKGNTAFESGHLTDPAETISHDAATGHETWRDDWNGIAWRSKTDEAGDTLNVRYDNRPRRMTFAEKYGLNRGNANDVSISEERLFGDGISNDEGARREDFWNLVRATEDTGRAGAGPVEVEPTNTESDNAGADLYRIPVTFDGVPGMLKCPGPVSDCGTLTSERTKEGEKDVGKLRVLNAPSGASGDKWTFTAAKSTDNVAGLGDREDSLTFGWWRQVDDAGGGFAAFEPIYGGRIPFRHTETLTTLKGSAKYEGGAAGNYTDYSGRGAPITNPEQIGDDTSLNRPDRHGGWFVAKAMLTARFDVNGNGNSDDKDFEIEGTISDFRGAHGPLGNKEEGGWKVELKAAALDVEPNTTGPNQLGSGDRRPVMIGTALVDATPVGVTPAHIGANTDGNADAQGWSGHWGAGFYGESAEDHSRLPSGVAGWFRAGTSADEKGLTGVAVQGAFAATRQP